MATAEIVVNVSGNLLPIARALTLMSDVLRVYGHRWSPEEQAVIDEAAERIFESAGAESRPDLDGRGN